MLKQVSEKLRTKIEDLLAKTDSKNFRALVFEKELTQLLSGYSNIERLKIDILKTLQQIEDKAKENELETIKRQLLQFVNARKRAIDETWNKNYEWIR